MSDLNPLPENPTWPELIEYEVNQQLGGDATVVWASTDSLATSALAVRAPLEARMILIIIETEGLIRLWRKRLIVCLAQPTS